MRNPHSLLTAVAAILILLSACDPDAAAPPTPDTAVTTDSPTAYRSVVDDAVQLWTDPEAWVDSTTGMANGRYPGAQDSVLIEEGSRVSINAAVSARHVTVRGELTANVSPATPSLTTHYVLVTGPSATFSVGTEASPFTGTFTLELVGVGDASEPSIDGPIGQERKFLMAMNGGTLSLHGHERLSWTHLGGDRMYDAGETSLTLTEEANWAPGDRIVFAPSVGIAGFEEAEIASIDGRTLTLASGLAHRHYGGAPTTYQAYDGGPVLTLDQRAEVGLLSRNVRIIGDTSSEIAGFGGHVMVMPGSHAHISNTELHRMGQRGSVGRYPIHWHLHGDTTGQFIANASIHRSYNRAVTVHGTSDVRVERTVAYDIAGHAFFLENGSEERNSFIGNLAIHVYRPDEAHAILESDFAFDEVQNRSPSSFWITNPANTFVGNVAAGSPGTGYWFALRANRDDFAGTGVYGSEKEITRFENNVAHNLMTGIDFHDAIKCEGCLDDLQRNLGWVKVGEPNLIQGFTAYSADIGIYSGTAQVDGYASANYTVEIRNSILADNINATFFASRALVSDSVVIAETFNGLTGLNQPRTALVLYDGAARFERCHFEGFDSATQPPTSFANQVGAAAKNVNWEFSECTGDSPRLAWPDYPAFAAAEPNLQSPNFEGNPRSWGTTFFDHTGSFIGAGRTLINNHPMMTVGDETAYTAAGSQNALHTHRRYGHLRVLYGAGFSGPGQQPDVFVTRFDFTGARPDIELDNPYKIDPGHQQAIIVGDNDSGVEFGYRLAYEDAQPLKRIDLELGDCMAAGQQAVIVVAGIGNYEGLSLTGTAVDHYARTPINVAQVESPEALLASQEPGYVVDEVGDLWVKLVSQAMGAPLVTTRVRWD